MILLPIDMPSNCIDCPCHDDDRGYCQLLKNDKADWEMDIDLFNNRRENCPLIEKHTYQKVCDTCKHYQQRAEKQEDKLLLDGRCLCHNIEVNHQYNCRYWSKCELLGE